MSQQEAKQRLQKIPVFFCNAMLARVEGISPSAHKPLAAVESWTALGIPLAIIEPTPATREDFTRAHDPDFVDAILECRAVNGFGTRAADVAASLPYTSGAMLSAARETVRNGQVAVAPTSGFHHAGHSEVAGFCTFNGLMVCALAIKAAGLVQRVGILDFDQHYGDGTDNIIETLGIDFVTQYTAGAHYHSGFQASEFLQRVPELVASMNDCDVVLYQAGADPHPTTPSAGGSRHSN